MIRSIALDAVCATEQWAKIVKRTSFKSPDPQSKHSYALEFFNAALAYYELEITQKMGSMVIESAVMQFSDRAPGFLQSFGLIDPSEPDDKGPV